MPSISDEKNVNAPLSDTRKRNSEECAEAKDQVKYAQKKEDGIKASLDPPLTDAEHDAAEDAGFDYAKDTIAARHPYVR